MSSTKTVTVILIFLLGVTLGAPLLSPQDAMMKAFKTGNYSIVEPYLSPLMKFAFSKKLFKITRDSFIKRFGKIEGYTLLKKAVNEGYVVYYYRVNAEKGSYVVSVAVRGGKVEGFHIEALPFSFNISAIYPALGAILGLLVLWVYLRKLHVLELILGAALLVLIILIQPFVQALPEFSSSTSLAVLWIGLIAALFQEPLKYYFSRNKTLSRALYVGTGFGLAEGVYLSVSTLFIGTSWLSIVERFLAVTFHSSTTILFAHAYANGRGREALLAMISIHWLLDSLAAYWHLNPSYLVLGVTYTVMASVAFVILFKLLPLAKS